MNDEMKSIGTVLGEARAEKGWTVQEAARRTKLKSDAIEKMEADEFELFPSISYARGFIRIYARELGLNGWALMSNFEDAPDVAVDGLDLHPDDLEAIPRRTQPPLATSQGIGLFVFGVVILIALTLICIKVYQVWPTGESTPNSSQTAAVTEPAQTTNVPEAGSVAVKEVSTPNPLTLDPVPAPAAPVAAPAVPTAPVAVPAAPAAQPVNSIPAPVTPVAALEPNPAQINRLRLRAPVNAPDEDRWVRVTGVNSAGEETILYESLIPAGATLPDPLSSAWTAARFRVKFRQAAAIQIILNETNYGAYERPGIQTVDLPIR